MRGTVIRRIAGTLAAIAQLVLIVATGAEAWHGRDASAHVESAGTRLHYAHDAATCVACAAQTLLAAASSRMAPMAGPDELGTAGREQPAPPPLPHVHPSNGSRAPPG
jgi:hypothetical protein